MVEKRNSKPVFLLLNENFEPEIHTPYACL